MESALPRDLALAPSLHFIDETTNLIGLRHEGARLDPSDRLANVGIDISERLERERRTDPRFVRNRSLYLLIREREHPAVAVMDEDDLFGAQAPLRDHQGADGCSMSSG